MQASFNLDFFFTVALTGECLEICMRPCMKVVDADMDLTKLSPSTVITGVIYYLSTNDDIMSALMSTHSASPISVQVDFVFLLNSRFKIHDTFISCGKQLSIIEEHKMIPGLI